MWLRFRCNSSLGSTVLRLSIARFGLEGWPGSIRRLCSVHQALSCCAIRLPLPSVRRTYSVASCRSLVAVAALSLALVRDTVSFSACFTSWPSLGYHDKRFIRCLFLLFLVLLSPFLPSVHHYHRCAFARIFLILAIVFQLALARNVPMLAPGFVSPLSRYCALSHGCRGPNVCRADVHQGRGHRALGLAVGLARAVVDMLRSGAELRRPHVSPPRFPRDDAVAPSRAKVFAGHVSWHRAIVGRKAAGPSIGWSRSSVYRCAAPSARRTASMPRRGGVMPHASAAAHTVSQLATRCPLQAGAAHRGHV